MARVFKHWFNTMSMPNISGSIVALVTPMTSGGKVDYSAFERLLDWHLAEGSNGIVVGGTTGESASLDGQEFERLLSLAVERVGGKIPVLAGAGSPDTRKALAMATLSAELGADAALVVTPYYNRPTQEGLKRHYEFIADGAGIPIILYNVPGRTGVDLLPATVESLAGHDLIWGIKEAAGGVDRCRELCRRVGSQMVVLSGDDPTAAQSMLAGASGVISVLANVCPQLFARLCAQALAGDREQAESLDSKLQPLNAAMGWETNPQPVKWALAALGKMEDAIRLPLLSLNEQHHQPMKKLLADMGLMEHSND